VNGLCVRMHACVDDVPCTSTVTGTHPHIRRPAPRYTTTATTHRHIHRHRHRHADTHRHTQTHTHTHKQTHTHTHTHIPPPPHPPTHTHTHTHQSNLSFTTTNSSQHCAFKCVGLIAANEYSALARLTPAVGLPFSADDLLAETADAAPATAAEDADDAAPPALAVALPPADCGSIRLANAVVTARNVNLSFRRKQQVWVTCEPRV
jgi:hypothetical protein